jgi:hypothetical protein
MCWFSHRHYVYCLLINGDLCAKFFYHLLSFVCCRANPTTLWTV